MGKKINGKWEKTGRRISPAADDFSLASSNAEVCVKPILLPLAERLQRCRFSQNSSWKYDFSNDGPQIKDKRKKETGIVQTWFNTLKWFSYKRIRKRHAKYSRGGGADAPVTCTRFFFVNRLESRYTIRGRPAISLSSPFEERTVYRSNIILILIMINPFCLFFFHFIPSHRNCFTLHRFN